MTMRRKVNGKTFEERSLETIEERIDFEPILERLKYQRDDLFFQMHVLAKSGYQAKDCVPVMQNIERFLFEVRGLKLSKGYNKISHSHLRWLNSMVRYVSSWEKVLTAKQQERIDKFTS